MEGEDAWDDVLFEKAWDGAGRAGADGGVGGGEDGVRWSSRWAEEGGGGEKWDGVGEFLETEVAQDGCQVL